MYLGTLLGASALMGTESLLIQQKITAHGVPVVQEPANPLGNLAAVGQGAYLHLRNHAIAASTVIMRTRRTRAGLAIADREIQIAAGADAMIPLRQEYRDPDTGLATIAYSQPADLTVGCFRA